MIGAIEKRRAGYGAISAIILATLLLISGNSGYAAIGPNFAIEPFGGGHALPGGHLIPVARIQIDDALGDNPYATFFHTLSFIVEADTETDALIDHLNLVAVAMDTDGRTVYDPGEASLIAIGSTALNRTALGLNNLRAEFSFPIMVAFDADADEEVPFYSFFVLLSLNTSAPPGVAFNVLFQTGSVRTMIIDTRDGRLWDRVPPGWDAFHEGVNPFLIPPVQPADPPIGDIPVISAPIICNWVDFTDMHPPAGSPSSDALIIGGYPRHFFYPPSYPFINLIHEPYYGWGTPSLASAHILPQSSINHPVARFSMRAGIPDGEGGTLVPAQIENLYLSMVSVGKSPAQDFRDTPSGKNAGETPGAGRELDGLLGFGGTAFPLYQQEQRAGRNDDLDMYAKSLLPLIGRIEDQGPGFDFTDYDYLKTDQGMFVPGVDFVVVDNPDRIGYPGTILGQLDIHDFLAGDTRETIVNKDLPLQLRGRNDDRWDTLFGNVRGDYYIDDPSNAGFVLGWKSADEGFYYPYGFFSTSGLCSAATEVLPVIRQPGSVGVYGEFDPCVDAIVADINNDGLFTPGIDLVLYPGISGFLDQDLDPNPFDDLFRNDDRDYYLPEGGAEALGFPTAAQLIPSNFPFRPGIDERILDNPSEGIRFQLDPCDIVDYAGANGIPDWDIRLVNDDMDYFFDVEGGRPGLYDRGVDTLILKQYGQPGVFDYEPFEDEDDNGLYDPGEPFEDLNGNGIWDSDLILVLNDTENGIPERGAPIIALIDEERRNGVDDDGDGLIDEDCDYVPLFPLIDEDPIDLLDNDLDGLVDEDPPNGVISFPIIPLIDEESDDGIDNDCDGFIDEDINYIPLFALIDEERLDYFIDRPGGRAGFFDFIDRNNNGIFDPEIRITVTPEGFSLSILPGGDIPLDEYYIDFNENGIYDSGRADGIAGNPDEFINALYDSTERPMYFTDPFSRYSYYEYALPVDNDGDGEVVNMDVYDINGDGVIDYIDRRLFASPNGVDDDGNGEFGSPLDAFGRAKADGLDNDGDGFIDEGIDEGFNEDCGDFAFYTHPFYGGDLNDAMAQAGPDPRPFITNSGIQVWRDMSNSSPVGDGTITPPDGLFIPTEVELAEYFYIDFEEGVPYDQTISWSGFYSRANNTFPYMNFEIPLSPVPYGGERDRFETDINQEGSAFFVSIRTASPNNTPYGFPGPKFGNDMAVVLPPESVVLSRMNFKSAARFMLDFQETPAGIRLANQAGTYSANFARLSLVGGKVQNGVILKPIHMMLWMGGELGYRSLTMGLQADHKFPEYYKSSIPRLAGDPEAAFDFAEATSGGLYRMPFVDVDAGWYPLLGINVCDHTGPEGEGSENHPWNETLESLRINFETVDLEGRGVFEVTDLKSIREGLTSGIGLFRDDRQRPGHFPSIFDNTDLPNLIPIQAVEWDPYPQAAEDPVVQAGGHFLILTPLVPVHLPSEDRSRENMGYDFHVAFQTSKTADYHDTFRSWVRDGDMVFRNTRNVVNSFVDIDPISMTVPTILTDLSPERVGNEDWSPMPANSRQVVLGIDMHDANYTFQGNPSRLRSFHVWFDAVDIADVTPTARFGVTDIAPLLTPDKAWVVIDRITGRTRPYNIYGTTLGPNERIGSLSGVAAYRDCPNSDNPGQFDDPFDPSVINADTPIMLSGDEAWAGPIGITYNVNLVLDPPSYSIDAFPDLPPYLDFNPVDPFDPDPLEPLPICNESPENIGDDFFVVIRTSKTIGYGVRFRVSVGSRVFNDGRIGFNSFYFHPPMINSWRHPWPITPPWSNASNNVSLRNTRILSNPVVTSTSLTDLVYVTPNSYPNVQEALSEPFSVIGISCFDGPGGNETVNSFRVEVIGLGRYNAETGTWDRRFDPTQELNRLDGSANAGLLVYNDTFGATQAHDGVFNPLADQRLPVAPTTYRMNFFADDPGPDGVFGINPATGVSDDHPRQRIGKYDEGIDVVVLDNGSVTGILDLDDEVIMRGAGNPLPYGATLYPLTNQWDVNPQGDDITAQYSVYLRLLEPAAIPPTDRVEDGANGPDFFIAARTSAFIDYKDRYRFHMARDGVTFSSGRSMASIDVFTGEVTTNIPVHLVDNTESFGAEIRHSTEVVAPIAIHMVNNTDEVVWIRNISVIFESVGDNNFSVSSLSELLQRGFRDGKYVSGIGVFRDSDGPKRGEFDFDQVRMLPIDPYIPLAAPPAVVGLGSNPFTRFRIDLTLDIEARDGEGRRLASVPSRNEYLTGMFAEADFYIAIRPAGDEAVRPGDDFIMRIAPGGIVFGGGAYPCRKSISTDVITLNINVPPRFDFINPPPGSETTVAGETFTIIWDDNDPDSDARINLYYVHEDRLIEGGDIRTGDSRLIPISGAQNIPVIIDGEGDQYLWNLAAQRVASGDPFRIVAIVDDRFNPPVIVLSSLMVHHNQEPFIEILEPSELRTLAIGSFLIEWQDRDPDNDARINLYLISEASREWVETRIEDLNGAIGTDIVPIARNLSENADGSMGSFRLDTTRLLLEEKISSEKEYYVLGVIDDGVRRVPEHPLVDPKPPYFDFSEGTLLASLAPLVQVIEPSIDRSPNGELFVSIQGFLPNRVSSVGGVDIFLNETNFGFDHSQQVPNGRAGLPETFDPFLLATFSMADLHFDASNPNVFSASRTIPIVNLDPDAGIVEFLPGLPLNKDVYVFAEVVAEVTSGMQAASGNFSEGRFRLNEHFVRVLEPANRIPSATAVDVFEVVYAAISRIPGDSNPTVSLYYDNNNRGLDGRLLRATDGRVALNLPLPPGGKTARSTFTWNVSSVGLSSLYVYAILNDAANDFGEIFHDYSDGMLRIGEEVVVRSGSGAYIVTGHGGIALAGAPELLPGAGGVGARVIRDMEPARTGKGYYLLASDGRVFARDGAPEVSTPYFGMDAAIDLEMLPGPKTSGYILDRFGGIHPIGHAKHFGSKNFGFDFARDLELAPNGNGYVILDAFGGIHTFGELELPNGPYFGMDYAVAIELTRTGEGYYILGRDGAVYAVGDAVSYGYNILKDRKAVDLLLSGGGAGYLVLDDRGGIQGFGDAAEISIVGTYPEGLALDLEEVRAFIFVECEEISLEVASRAVPAVGAYGDSQVRVLWSQDDPFQGRNLYLYDSATGENTLFDGSAGDQTQPAIEGNLAVWTSQALGNRDIYFRNMGDDSTGAINLTASRTNNQEQPDISGRWVVWAEYDVLGNDFDIYLLDIGPVMMGEVPGAPTLITNSTVDPYQRDQRAPRVYAQKHADGENVYIVWEDMRFEGLDVYLQTRRYNLSGSLLGVTTEVLAGGSGDQFAPSIHARRIAYEGGIQHGEYEVWVTYTDNKNGDLNIFAVPLSTRQRMALPSDPSIDPSIPTDTNAQRGSCVSGQRITWVDRRDGFDNIYFFDFLVASTRPSHKNGEIRFTAGTPVIPEASTDGRWIVYMLESQQGVTLNLAEIKIEILGPAGP